MSWTLKITVWLYQEHENQQDIFQKHIPLQFNHLCQLCINKNPTKLSLLFLRCWDAPREIRCWSAEVEHICRESQMKKVALNWQSFQAGGSAAHVGPVFFAMFFHMKELVHPKNPVDMCGEVAAPFFGVFEKHWFISFCCVFFQTVRHSFTDVACSLAWSRFFSFQGHWTTLRSVSS